MDKCPYHTCKITQHNVSTNIVENVSTNIVENVSTDIVENVSTDIVENVSTVIVENVSTDIVENDIECPICYDKIELRNYNDEINDLSYIKLDCGHVFHYKCIFDTFKTNLINKKNTRRCPFCRVLTSYIPLKKYIFPMKNIHKEYDIIKDFLYKGDYKYIYKLSKKYDFLNKEKCHAIVTTGINKGTQCKKTKKDGLDFCFIHHKKFSEY